ncbi:protein kinase domain-containing protein [Sorangium atrum]|uniref:Protein kinase n=1 Tax=Sorangium atrum TaxID=2995308 RepID=A0ABT5CET9_9BACT|nr:protein kinase [Sorangium aterium]MDC0684946.1 protein kinase [Sorangium aterium]
MRPGDLLAGRFELDRVAGSGGMGAVYRAIDRETGEPVAVKVGLHAEHAEGEQTERFRREARVLAGLHHPAIARHVAHGVTAEGRQYLAMEWLDGEDLAARLRRGPLGLDESLALAARAAEALGAVHLRGVVHRDIKPANLFLPGGDVAAVKILDFGIARASDVTYTLTNPDAPVGTPAYMAPEQVRGEPDIDARADLYALGCVLFECLTGRPPFVGSHVVALLTKVLFAQAPRLRELWPGAPPALDTLLSRLLGKDRQLRPGDALTIAAELRSPEIREASAAPLAPSVGLTTAERRLVTVVLATRQPEPARPPQPAQAVASDESTAPARGLTHQRRWPLALLREIRRTADLHGARVELLQDGSIAALLTGAEAPTDLAASAARCALSLKALLQASDVALATGWEVVDGTQPLGTVIDRAVANLTAAERGAEEALRPIAIDAMTASLLGPRFEVAHGERGAALLGEQEPLEEARALLGKPTPFVGRSSELRWLELLFDQCASEPCAQAALVIGAAGVGKSRLRIELARRMRGREAPPQIWTAQGDAVRAGAPLGLLAQVVRRAAQIAEGEPRERGREKLAARVARSVDAAEQARVTEFLGEVIGAPFPDADRRELRAARQNPMLMADQVRRAWLTFLEAECRAGPVLLVLEDLHWGDLPTVQLVDAALGQLRSSPLLVLGLGRPDVDEVFPGLWAERGATAMRLGALPALACERLVRAALGEQAPAAQVERLVRRAAGHPFLLEEMLRVAAEGAEGAEGRDAGEAPETALAMVQARLEGLDLEARRALRAGSLLGEVFWWGAIARLLGVDRDDAALAGRLLALEQQEWIARRPASRFPGEVEYAFRHGLVRDAAYMMLTEADQRLGHRLASEWLEHAGERDALVLAGHCERGGEPERAVRWLCAAAEEALRGNDLAAALARAERGVASGASGRDLGALRLVQAEAHLWRGELSSTEARATEAIALLDPGSGAWYRALTAALLGASKQGAVDRAGAWAERLAATAPAEEALSVVVLCLSGCAAELMLANQHATADALLEQCLRLAGDPPTVDDEALGGLHQAVGFRAALAGDHAAAVDALEVAVGAFGRAGDRRQACSVQLNMGFILTELGALERAEQLLRAAVAQATQMDLHEVLPTARQNLGNVLLQAGQIDEARALLEQAIDASRRQGNRRMEGLSRAYLARAALLSGDREAAAREAGAAAALLDVAPLLRAVALALLARARMGGEPEGAAEALLDAQEAFRLIEDAGMAEEGESLIRLTYAEALRAAGERERAAKMIEAARSRLLERAAKIGRPALRQSFLESIPENARALALADAWALERQGAVA